MSTGSSSSSKSKSKSNGNRTDEVELMAESEAEPEAEFEAEAVSSPASPTRFGGSAYKRSTNFAKKSDRKKRGVSGEVSPTSLSPSASQSSLQHNHTMSPESGNGHLDDSHRSSASASSLPPDDGMGMRMPISPNLDTSDLATLPVAPVIANTLSPSQLHEWMSPTLHDTTADPENRNPFRSLRHENDDIDITAAGSHTEISHASSSKTETTSNINNILSPQDDDRTVQTSNVDTQAHATNQSTTKYSASTIPSTIQSTTTPLPNLLTTATTSDDEDEDFYTDHMLQQSRERALELQNRKVPVPPPLPSVNDSKATTNMTNEQGNLKIVTQNSNSDAVQQATTQTATTATVAPVTPSWELPAKTAKQLFGGEMYQTMEELAPVLSIVEAKRKSWFQREMTANQCEWDHYRVWLRSTVNEVTHVEGMISDCLDAFSDYAAALGDLAHDNLFDDNGQMLTKKKSVFSSLQRGTDKTTATETAKPLLDPMTQAYGDVKTQVDTYLISLKGNLDDATALKNEIMAQTKNLEDKGRAIGTVTVEQAEANIQEAFQSLITAAADWVAQDDPDLVANDANADASEREAATMKDRWLLESRYRNAAKLGLLTWKEHRRDFQNLFVEIIQLDGLRKTRLEEILLSFLPKRNKLLNCVHGSLVEGSGALEASKVSMKKENDAIEQAIAEISRASLDLTEQPPISSVLQETSLSDVSAVKIWDSAYVKYRRVVTVKTSGKSAICVVTLDHHLQVFVVGDELNDTSETASLSLDAIAPHIKVVVPEYSIKLCDFEVSYSDSSATNSTVDIDFSRRARSKIFRKKDDNFVLQVKRGADDDDDVTKWADHVVALSTDVINVNTTALIPPPLPLQPSKPKELTEI